jgi:hypothetical protein
VRVGEGERVRNIRVRKERVMLEMECEREIVERDGGESGRGEREGGEATRERVEREGEEKWLRERE